MDNVPTKESGDGKWFIRPHHLESLTNHPNSVKDDVLNTRYISHYDQEYGKQEEVDKNVEAIEKLETHLSTLRSTMKMLLINQGANPDVLEEMAESTDLERLGRQEYEGFINDKTRYDNNNLIIDAYEGVIGNSRVDEKTILNKKRFTEHEKNRPPQDNWFEMKGQGF